MITASSGRSLLVAGTTLLVAACGAQKTNLANSHLDYCVAQAAKTAAAIPSYDSIPRTIATGKDRWRYVNYRDWTSGFWPGTLWYLYEYTKDTAWKAKAQAFTNTLRPIAFSKAGDHDIGFQLYCSYGNGYRLTGDTAYKSVMLAAADTLATLFNPVAGTILSWPHEVQHLGGHNTIIDNMMNLELLFWAAKNGGGQRLYDMAVQHANTTMKNHFRPDFTSYHVVVYDTITGKVIRQQTHQGYADSTMWARGQAWGIYGYTLMYRETKDTTYRRFAQSVADVWLQRLPQDGIPYWDFQAPDIPRAPKDASAAAITASALLELSTMATDAAKATYYRQQAEALLTALSSNQYQARHQSPAFLLHATGHKPNGSEIDASINYADYYYIEALTRLRQLQEGKR
ncbi:glycoside hydrolase family 88 protein [Paraflavitalea pollutisoli]|uniref:glycoside hydrolase family 88 protein n=1 Tax=Paraflavitalea pollutisoli TaxID=3034143 RepID=UPI0023EDFD04|nr:glycoside hydrolase family 88 protein [Paraflavitalea sp. H1-2-19X]